MAFTTKLDYSDNRQIKQHIGTHTDLSGGTSFGVSFADLPFGPDLPTTGIIETYDLIASTFYGDDFSTTFSWFDPRMSLGESTLSAITPSTSATTQIAGPIFAPSDYITVDGNLIPTAYTGVTFDLSVITMTDLGGGTYSGTVETETFNILSAGTNNYTGRTIWVDVSGKTRTEELIITKDPVIDYVFTCIDSEGLGAWMPATGGSGSTGNVFWSAGTGNNGITTLNSGNIASGDYAVAEGYDTQAIGQGSHAEGSGTTAFGGASHAEGVATLAYGGSSHVEGVNSIASGYSSHAEGTNTQANGDYSHSQGAGTRANGPYSFASGIDSIANGRASFVHGTGSTVNGANSIVFGINITGDSANTTYVDYLNIKRLSGGSPISNLGIDANGNVVAGTSGGGGGIDVFVTGGTYSLGTATFRNNTGGTFNVTGFSTGSGGTGQDFWSAGTGTYAIVTLNSTNIASGTYALAEGKNTQAIGDASHAEGSATTAGGNASHAEGWGTQALAELSHAEGYLSIVTAGGFAAHAEGLLTTGSSEASHAEGSHTLASGGSAHAEGASTLAGGSYSHAEGYYTRAFGTAAHSSGMFSIAYGNGSYAGGSGSTASGQYSFAHGYNVSGTGEASHAIGIKTNALGDYSHAEGSGTTAQGDYSHAEGASTIASGQMSHAEGQLTRAYGYVSHAEGSETKAIGNYSHAQGIGTEASGMASHAEGYQSHANGDYSHSQGFNTEANGEHSFVGGSNSYAHGDYSFAYGSASTANFLGTFVFGNGINGTQPNTTYVDGLNIKSIPAGPGTIDIGVDATGKVVNQASDIRLKENINTIENALDTVLKLRGVTYNWKDRESGGNDLKIGLIAQEVLEIVPELVTNNGEYLGVQYKDIPALLIEAIKELVEGKTEFSNKFLETQTILAEDNNIELNYNGTEETSIGGGIKVLREDLDSSDFVIDADGNWVSNTNIYSEGFVIPEYTPTSSSDEAGIEGNITRDEDYVYIKTKSGWKRTGKLDNF